MTQPDRLREALPTLRRALSCLRAGAFDDAADELDDLIAALAAPAPDLLAAVEATERLGVDLVNDHRGIPYDVIERVDELAALLRAPASLEAGMDKRAAALAEAAPAPDLIAEHVHDAEVCFGCAEVHERALAEQDIITGHIPASREAAPDLLAAVEAKFREAIGYGIAIETDYFGRGQPGSMIDEPSAEWASEVLALLRAAPRREAGPDVERLEKARDALIATGYFRPDEVGPDIAPRIIELWAAREAGLDAGHIVDNCIAIVRQSLDTVRDEAGDLPSGRVGVAAREHVIALLSGYAAHLASTTDREGSDEE